MEKKKFNSYRLIRVLTVAPLLALVALSVLYFVRRDIFAGTEPAAGVRNYLFTVLFLTVLPLLAYPLQPFVPGFRGKGRDGQRRLAIVMAVLGYLCAAVYAFVAQAPVGLKIICLSYFCSGMLIALFNKVLHIKASGHACGVAGPVGYLCYFCGPWALLALPMVALVFYVSLKMKRHTMPQLCAGACVALLSMLPFLLFLA